MASAQFALSRLGAMEQLSTKVKKYVGTKGIRRYRIAKADVRGLIAEFYKIDSFLLKEEYKRI